MGFLSEVINSYLESRSFLAGEIQSGPPPDLAEPTADLAIKNVRSIAFQQPGTASWQRHGSCEYCTTIDAALVWMFAADLDWDMPFS